MDTTFKSGLFDCFPQHLVHSPRAVRFERTREWEARPSFKGLQAEETRFLLAEDSWEAGHIRSL